MSEQGPHNAQYMMLKFDYDMNYLVLIHYKAEIFQRSPEAGGSEPYIVDALSCGSHVLQRLCDVRIMAMSLNVHKV